MRRKLASLLLVLWIAGCCEPMLAAASQLPACCRLNGKHHCARPVSDGVQAAAPSCPYQHGTALASQPNTALLVFTQPVFLNPVHPLRLNPPFAPPARPHVANRPGRGPPVLS